jgi:hypothetical protein
MNKTDDIEWGISQVLLDGPITLEEMERRLPAELQGDRRWIGVAVYRMLGDGRIRAVGCDHGSHEGTCVVEAHR